jgi:hypothetical protein
MNTIYYMYIILDNSFFMYNNTMTTKNNEVEIKLMEVSERILNYES